MTSSIKILTTNTLDSAPSIILIAPNGKHTLINCGEGCQRSFLDARTNSQGQNQNGIGLRLKSIDRICVTQLTHACLGGLPGFILTSADTTSSASSDSKGTKIAKLQEGSNIHKKQISEANQKIEAGLTIWGPKGSSTFINSLRHFMRRDKFLLDIKEGPQSPQAKTKNGPKNMKKSKKRKKKSCMEEDDGEFRVECIPTLYTLSLPMASLETDEKKENDFKTKQNSHDKDPVTRTEEPDGQNSTIPPNSQQYTVPVQSYIFTTPPIQAKFNVQKALELGIPKGPLYARLKNGETIKYTSTIDGLEHTATSDQVLMSNDGSYGNKNSCPYGVSIAIVACPDLSVLRQLQSNAILMKYKKKLQTDLQQKDMNSKSNQSSKNKEGDIPDMDLMIHITSKHLYVEPEYQKWRNSFDEHVKHLLVPTISLSDFLSSNANDSSLYGRSPFDAACIQAMARNMIHKDLYSRSCSLNPNQEYSYKSNKEEYENHSDFRENLNNSNEMEVEDESEKNDFNLNSCKEEQKGDDHSKRFPTKSDLTKNPPYNDHHSKDNECCQIMEASQFLEYVIIPRAKKGFMKEHVKSHTCHNSLTNKEFSSLVTKLSQVGAIRKANDIQKEMENISPNNIAKDSNISNSTFGELSFTGTGSAIPSKHRNVTGNYLQMKNGNAILLDVGEGTFGQLLRLWSSSSSSLTCKLKSSMQQRIASIKAIWISHPHADHHLGLIRLLSERRLLCPREEPPILIAPMPIFRFLEEYARVDPILRNSYDPLDCRFLPATREGTMNIHPYLRDRLRKDLGITNIHSIPVAHCAHAHAVLLTGTLCPFGNTIAFSGDCRPSDRLAQVGKGADVLIHEATFEDGMEEEAVLKRHSTVSEAVNVGMRMGVKYVVLTHFSQRYPKIPIWTGKGKIRSNSEQEESTNDKNMKVIFAFDFMTIKEENIHLASEITPALRLLYPAEGNNDDDDSVEEASPLLSAKEILSKPGVFADSSLYCQN